jgi:antitoxin (DNA-binding transcriptional repressor) of toxin-antitoxin stability system
MYSIRQAQKSFSMLLQKAVRGEEVIIARGRTPVAKLVAVPTQKKKRIPGRGKGKISYTPDACAPMTKEELAE